MCQEGLPIGWGFKSLLANRSQELIISPKYSSHFDFEVSTQNIRVRVHLSVCEGADMHTLEANEVDAR